MKLTKEKVVTIITEGLIENKLITDLKKLGVTGYTIEDVRGEGKHGLRNSDWDQSSTVRIQIICDIELSERITMFINEHYMKKYAMFVFKFDAEVLNGN